MAKIRLTKWKKILKTDKRAGLIELSDRSLADQARQQGTKTPHLRQKVYLCYSFKYDMRVERNGRGGFCKIRLLLTLVHCSCSLLNTSLSNLRSAGLLQQCCIYLSLCLTWSPWWSCLGVYIPPEILAGKIRWHLSPHRAHCQSNQRASQCIAIAMYLAQCASVGFRSVQCVWSMARDYFDYYSEPVN